MIQVSTFRAYLDATAAEQVTGNEKTSRKDLADKTHVVDASGACCRVTTSGARRTRTPRAATSPSTPCTTTRHTGIVVDYHGGIKDAKKRVLRMIGDPDTRYREDPVRIVRARALRSQARASTSSPRPANPCVTWPSCSATCRSSRLFDEMLELLQTGHASASLEQLRKQGLDKGVFQILDAVFDEVRRHPAATSSSNWPWTTPTAAWPRANPWRPASCWPACCGTTC